MNTSAVSLLCGPDGLRLAEQFASLLPSHCRQDFLSRCTAKHSRTHPSTHVTTQSASTSSGPVHKSAASRPGRPTQPSRSAAQAQGKAEEAKHISDPSSVLELKKRLKRLLSPSDWSKCKQFLSDLVALFKTFKQTGAHLIPLEQIPTQRIQETKGLIDRGKQLFRIFFELLRNVVEEEAMPIRRQFGNLVFGDKEHQLFLKLYEKMNQKDLQKFHTR